ncbi:MAG: hypothetical protein ABI171_02435 [Collimonas sp.]|uniref:hypothetical protein n=1 Tax=Collimonas sp. TaxID=1963772 RepID=UPI0032645613
MNPAETAAYADNQELLQELRQIGDGMIERALLLRQLATGPSFDETETDDRLAALYRQASRRQAPSSQLQQQLAQLGSALQRSWNRLARRSAASIRSQVFLPWVHLALLFQLSQRDQELLLCAFLAELDQRYHAILQAVSSDPEAADDGQGFTPLASAAVMLGGALADRIDMQQSLMSNAALRQWDLIELAGGSRLGALSGGYRLNAAIASYLLARRAAAAPGTGATRYRQPAGTGRAPG